MVGEPGFTKEAMTALKTKVLAEKQDGQEIFARRCWMRCPHANMFNGMARSTHSLSTLMMMIHCQKPPKALCL